MYSNLDMMYRIQKSNQRIFIYVYIQFGCDDRIEEKTDNNRTHTHTHVETNTSNNDTFRRSHDWTPTGRGNGAGGGGGGVGTHCLSHYMNITRGEGRGAVLTVSVTIWILPEVREGGQYSLSQSLYEYYPRWGKGGSTHCLSHYMNITQWGGEGGGTSTHRLIHYTNITQCARGMTTEW